MLVAPDFDIIAGQLSERYMHSCPICRGSGFAYKEVEDPAARKRQDCECRKEYNFQIGLRFGNVPSEFWGVESMKIVHNLTNLKIVDEYCAHLRKRRSKGVGFIMYGENGAGKTAMGTLILARAIRAGMSVSYVTAHDYLQAGPASWSDPALKEWLQDIVDADFMVLDELGKEYRKQDASRLADIDTLLRRRRGDLKPTILITNCSVSEFREKYGESIVSILSDRNKALVYEPGDYRRTNKPDVK